MKTFKDLLAEKPSSSSSSLKGDKMFPQRTRKDASKETQRSDKEKLADIRKDREKDSVKKRTDAINKQKDAAVTKEKEKAQKKISGLGEELVGKENSPGGAIMKKTFKEISENLREGTNARQRGEVQSPRSQKEYDALSPKDKKIVDKRIANAKKQGMSPNPGESPRNKKKKINTKQDRERRRSLARHGHITSGDDIAPGVMTDDEMNEASEVLMVHTKKTPKGDFRWMLQTIKYGKNTTVMTGNEPTRAKAMAAGKKAKKAAGKEKGMTTSAKKNRKDYGDHLAGQDEARSPGYKMPQSKDPYTVKYSARKNGPVKISVVDGKKAALKFVKDIKKQGMNGIIVKGNGLLRNEESGMWTVKYSDPKTGKPAGTTTPATHKKAEAFLKKLIARGYTGELVKEDVLGESVIDEGGMGGDRHFNVNKGGSIPSNAEIKAFYEKQKGSHSQKIAATKKHFGLQKMTVSAKGNISAKGIRENEGVFEAKKRPMSAAQKARHEKHQKLLKITGAKKSKAPRKKARGKTEISKTASRYEDIEKEIDEMKETYAPGNITRMPSPDFDERQGMFNSNYKRINGRSPSKAELRAAGVGKGGDNPKGVKAWKAAMAKLKASNNEEKKLSYKERMKILKDLDMQIGGKKKKKGKKR